MFICPICNGFEEIQTYCPSCGNKLEDKGRLMDYFDDYSAYMPIDQMKLEDGYVDDNQNHKCPHLLYCSSCGADHVTLINE